MTDRARHSLRNDFVKPEMEKFMQINTCRANERSRWTHGMALERRFGLPRGMLIAQAPNPKTLVDRVLATTHLDGDTLGNLTRILATSVQHWTQRRI